MPLSVQNLVVKEVFEPAVMYRLWVVGGRSEHKSKKRGKGNGDGNRCGEPGGEGGCAVQPAS